MIVLDASAMIDWLLQTLVGQQIEHRIRSRNETLHAPHVLDLEVTQGFRRLVRQRAVPPNLADAALRDLFDMRLNRYPHTFLLPRIWQLRDNLSAYDAAYISLAELLGAALITRDARLASAPNHVVRVEVF